MSKFNDFISKNKKRVIIGTWKDTKNHKLYAEWLYKRLEYSTMEDWYQITVEKIHNNYGGGLLTSYYKSSYSKFLEAVYPDYKWIPWLFGMTSPKIWKDRENHLLYAEWLSKRLEFTEMDDWYQITVEMIHNNYGGGLLLSHYGDNPYKFLNKVYTDYIWIPWKFNHTSTEIWKDCENHKLYAEWLYDTLGFKKMEDWYQITVEKIHNNYGGGLLTSYYKSSYTKFLEAVYPDYKWIPWLFGMTKIWKDIENHKLYAEWLSKRLEFTKMEDWYQITLEKIRNNYGGGLIDNHYKSSPILFLKAVYPDYKWIPWLFGQTCNNFWDKKKNQKEYLLWLYHKLGFKKMEDWYDITQKIFNDNYGSSMLHKYNGSPIKILQSIYPRYKWIPWLFGQTYNNFWDDDKNYRIYAEWLFKRLRFTKIEDWYNITCDIVCNNYGRTAIKKYHDSPLHFLQAVYPDYKWIPWLFGTTPKIWKDENNHRWYAEWLFKRLGFTKMDDWYSVTQRIIIDNYGGGLLCEYYNGSPKQFLQAVYPDYKWESSKFYRRYSQGQIEWCDFLKITEPDIRHALNHDDGEFSIPNSRYHADGYSEKENTINEYLGDFWHGNLKIYNKNEINNVVKKTFGELYEYTLKRQKFCENNGYKYRFIWESQWKTGKNAVIKLQRKFRLYLSSFQK